MSLPVTRHDIANAHRMIASSIRRTPLLETPLPGLGQATASLKLECLQHAGSFKTRGAFHTLLCQAGNKRQVTAASGGNHGIAVALAANRLGLTAHIFVPEIASPVKIAAIRDQGAQVTVGGARYADAQTACDRYAAESGALLVHPFDAAQTVAGQGTVALEWEDDLSRAGLRPLDSVLVAVGGGGLIAGMAAWWAGRVTIIGVEPVGSRAMHAALAAGRPVDVDVHSIAADSLGARRVGTLPFTIARHAVERVVLVEDAAIGEAQRLLWSDLRIASEPGGAAALAALLSGAYRPAPGERTGIMLCGGNVALESLAGTASV